MKEEDKKKFSLLMRRLRVTFPTSLNDKDESLRADVYWEEFKNTSIEKFESAVNEAIGALSFFPKPAELWEFIKQQDRYEYLQDQASMADLHKIDWQEPTKKGREIAIKLMNELKNRWKIEDEQKEKERTEQFEKRRKELKKQAKLLKEKEVT